jgi:transposase
MVPRPEELPDDVAALKDLVIEKATLVEDLMSRIERLEHNAEVFRKLALGPKSEKRAPEPDTPGQTYLFHEELKKRAEELAQEKAVATSTTLESPPRERKRNGRRKKFPPHLPRVRTVCELPEEERVCCDGVMEEMGEEITKELERIEITLVHEIVRKKYCCRRCQGHVKIAPGPDRVIDKGLLGVGFLAHVLAERFGNHMPYYRQEKKYAGEGLDLSRVVLCQSSQRCGEILFPIYEQVGKDVLSSPVVHTDDTAVTEIRSQSGGRRTARFWVYADHEGRCFYDFTESRERDGPMKRLGNFTGYIQADAYAGYNALYSPEGAREVACWAHCRRKLVEAESSAKELSKEAVERIRQLYAIERAARERQLGPEGIFELRQQLALPILKEMRAWLEMTQTQVLPKSPMGRAIRYALNQWEALVRYTESGLLEIDNNRAERALRAIAVGRKNWMHVMNEVGGRTAAVIYTLVQTCKEIRIDPRIYLRDVLLRINRCSDVASLTPHGWKERWAPEVMKRKDAILAKLTATAPA